MRSKKSIGGTAVLLIAVLVVSACGGATGATSPGEVPETGALAGDIAVDGSSTVFPITEAVAEEFGAEQPGVRVTVGISGTGGGFKKFCAGETDLQDASRAIKDSEKDACAQAGIEYTELLVGLDGLTVVVNPENTFAECLTVEQLKAIWEPNRAIDNWNQVDPSFPDQPLTLYGPGTDSGTFDFFTEVIVGEAKASRPDFTASEDDNVLVQGIAGDPNALGCFGLAYYIENQDQLKAMSIDGGTGCVAPSFETVNDSRYAPLSRPLYLYVRNDSLDRPEVLEFVRFYLTAAPSLVPEVGYVTAEPSAYQAGLEALEAIGQ